MTFPEQSTRFGQCSIPASSGEDVPPPLPPPRYLPGLPGDPAWGTTAGDLYDWKHKASYPTDSNRSRRASHTTPPRNTTPTSPAAASASSFGSDVTGSSYPPRQRGRKRKRVPEITLNELFVRQTPPNSHTRGTSPMAFSDSAIVHGASTERTYIASSQSSQGRLSDPEGSFTQDADSDRGDLSVWCCYLHNDSTGEPCRKTFRLHSQLSRHKRVCHPRETSTRRYSFLEPPRENPTRRHRSRRGSSPQLASPRLSSPRVSSPAPLLDRLSAARERFRRHIDARAVDGSMTENLGGR